MIKIYETQRGFKRADFKDLYQKDCSIQESSLATECAIWLGEGSSRMHLNQEMAADLMSFLECFVLTGHLPEVNHV